MDVTLYQPDIAQNLGAVMRLGACFQINIGIIEPCGFPLTTKALRRTAMDYGQPDDLIRYQSWDDYSASAPGRIVLFSTKAATRLGKFDFQASDRLLFGRESAGVPETVHAACHERVIIPISTDVRSFNLATSAAIGLYEALRQTGGLP
ncbi:MAG: tRNA (cytidine(34)-2'-O)-methyltransferase [Hellea sp.]|nr:tRNA (cytidine(34)-2'-O)-methyltransferase [Hellea sp.]